MNPTPPPPPTAGPKLSDFVAPAGLREWAEALSAVAGARVEVLDGEAVVRSIQAEGAGDADAVALVFVDGALAGAVRVTRERVAASPDPDDPPFAPLVPRARASARRGRPAPDSLPDAPADAPAAAPPRGAVLRLARLLAAELERAADREVELRQRLVELTALSNVSRMLAEARDPQRLLDRALAVVVDVMGVKAGSIRLIDRAKDELVIRAAHHLSDEYRDKGPVNLSNSAIERVALGPQGYEYVADLRHDPRVQYPGEAAREGVVSMLSVGLVYHGEPIGVLRVYTAERTTFARAEIDLLQAIAGQLAAAIENSRLAEEASEAAALERQLQLAGDVQQRMLPGEPPRVPGLDLASVYVPAKELGGDLYDFIPLPGDNLGIVIADVSGKGVPASLIMASVRAFLRAQTDNVYYLYEVVRRVNQMLCRDTKPQEFVTLFYGVYDARTRRLTFCDAGHPPGILLREGEITELPSENLILGVDPDAPYAQSFIDLRPGDALLLYTDGLIDAMNFADERFGYDRVIDALRRVPGLTPGQSMPAAATIAQHLLWEVRRFAGLSDRNDDVTMVVARVE